MTYTTSNGMKLLSKRDVIFAVITGLIAGIIAWAILGYAWLIVTIPILWLLGVQLGYFLGKWIAFFDQFGKFSAIGFTNFAVDAGVLNLLMYLTGIVGGIGFSLFKSISFVIAVLHSYVWNKTWTFQSKGASRQEFIKFMVVMLASWAINVGVASLVVHTLSPSVTHANLAAIVGSAIALIFSFIGFRIVVFK